MEYLQRLLGALQQAVDFASSFTTYLLGNAPYPGAEDPSNTREPRNGGNHHDYELETTHNSRDVSPREHLEFSEGPLTAEEIPPKWEILVTPDAAIDGAQPIESIAELSKRPSKYEGWAEKSEETLSEICPIPADAPEETVATPVAGSIKDRDLEGSTLTQGTRQWSWIDTSEKEVKGQLADTKWGLDWALAGGKEHGELSVEGGISIGQEELEGNLWNEKIQQGTPNWTQFSGEQEGEVGKAAQTGRDQDEEMEKIVEDPQMEFEKYQKEVEVIKEQLNIVVVKGEIQQDLLDTVETFGDLEKVLEEENKVGRTQPWEPEEVGETSRGELEEAFCNEGVQEGTPDWAPFVEECHEGTDEATEDQELNSEKVGKVVEETEGNQQGEPDMMIVKEASEQATWNGEETGVSQQGLEEKDKSWGRSNQWETRCELEEVGETNRWKRKPGDISLKDEVQEEMVDQAHFAEQHGSLQQAEWTEGFQNKGLRWADRTLKGVHLEAEREQEKIRESDKSQQAQSYIVAEKEELQQEMLDGAETEEVELEGEKEVGRNHQWDAEHAGWTMASQEKELEKAFWSRAVQSGPLLVEEEQRKLEEAAWSGEFQHERLEKSNKMVDGKPLEVEKEDEDEEDHQIQPSMAVAKEGLQQTMWDETETKERQVEGEDEVVESHQWELKGKVEEAEGSEVAQERELRGVSSNEKIQQSEPYQEQFVGEQPKELVGVTWCEGFQHRGPEGVTKVLQSPQLETEKERGGEAEGEENKQGVKEVIQHVMFSGAEAESEHKDWVERKEVGRNQQWEVDGTVLFEEWDGKMERVATDTIKGHQGLLTESETLEGHTERELKKTERNKMESKEEEKQTGVILETDQREEPEILADTSACGEEALTEVTGYQAVQPVKTEICVQADSIGNSPSLEEGPLSGPQTFPNKVVPLDTSAQKERVLLRRKSSIRRAPSVKRLRLPVETSPQGSQIAEDMPPLLQAPERPTMRHSGFGPMHPDMMAELQMRLRKPQ